MLTRMVRLGGHVQSTVHETMHAHAYLEHFSLPEVRWQLMKQREVLAKVKEMPTAPLLPVRAWCVVCAYAQACTCNIVR